MRSLRLDDQLCFRLYAASRMLQQRYRPVLDSLGLTYPQYLVMMVLWEHDGLSMKGMGDKLQLDSGTLTPLLKRMEKAGWLRRTRSVDDGRMVLVHLTAFGRALEARAETVPQQLVACLGSEPATDPAALAGLLDQFMADLSGAS
jgi:DNA-binding MarR family transcriptional regulator